MAKVPSSWVPVHFSLVRREGTNLGEAELTHRWNECSERFANAPIVVRSDGPAERYQPGAGTTEVCRYPDLAAAVARVAHGGSEPLVQAAIEPAGVGGMSNGRQLCARRDLWLAEGPLCRLAPQVQILRAVRPVSTDDEAARTIGDDVRPALRVLAAYLGDGSDRYRVEWVWDGDRVWVVQVDVVADPPGDPDVAQYLTRRHDPALKQLVESASDYGEWRGPKVISHRTLGVLGTPLVPLHARRCDEVRNDEHLERWLRQVVNMYDDPIVLRTDTTSAAPFLLPTSTPSRDVAALAQFARRSLRELAQQSASYCEVGVLASPLLATAGSALAMTDPASAVHIDCIWGSPDGLLHLPHDTYVIRDGRVRLTNRRKPACVVLASEEKRRQVALGAPWDWRAALTASQAKQVAAWSRQLSHMVGRSVQLMVLVRSRFGAGTDALVPFHYFDQSYVSPDERRKGPHGRRLVVTEPKDLTDDAEAGDWIDLRPQPDRLRDRTFFVAVADYAARRQLPIGFAGSRLGHARYILEERGATVFVVDERQVAKSTEPVVVLSKAGLLRLSYVDADRFGRASARLGTRTHPAFPGVPWLDDDDMRLLGPPPAGAGEVVGFVE